MNADAPKWHRECETCQDEATVVLSFFFAEKKYKKIIKNVKLKKGLGHGGIRRSCLRSQRKRSETQKTEFALGNHIKNTFFERNKHELKKLEK